jgi:putative ABC transport system permease protein
MLGSGTRTAAVIGNAQTMANFAVRTALRNLSKHKGYNALNILGLAIGMACAGLIFLWVEDELQFDHHQANRDNIYMVMTNEKVDNGIFTHSSTPGPLAASLKAKYPQVADVCRIEDEGSNTVLTYKNEALSAHGIYTDPSLFNLFTFTWVAGDKGSVFTHPYSIVLTQSTAKKYFGDDPDPVGKSLETSTHQSYTVTGIVADPPANSSIHFEWTAPIESILGQHPELNNWQVNGLTTYVLLRPGTDPAPLNKEWADPNYDYTVGKVDHTNPSTSHNFLFEMNNWNLHSEFVGGIPTGGGRIQYVRLFTSIAWIILLIACINFMNLATARSQSRSKEVGVRKVLGAGRKGLVRQFLFESVFMALIAAVIAVMLMSASIQAFNLLVQKDLSLHLSAPTHWAVLLGITLVCGLVAGSYPALYLSSFNPVFVLKGIKLKEGSAELIRRGLVIVQFTISITLVIGTVVVYQQINHTMTRNLGFEKNHLLTMNLTGDMLKHFQATKNDLLATGAVVNAALADHSTLEAGNNTMGLDWEGKDPGSNIVISQRLVSPEYMQTLGMHIADGRDFQMDDAVNLDPRALDTTRVFPVLITSSMAAIMGQGNPLGKRMILGASFGKLHMQVVGVVKDYVYGDMYGLKDDPVVFYCLPNLTSQMYIRLNPNIPTASALAKIGAVMKKMNPGYPFEYAFVDDQFNQHFQAELLVSKLSRAFAGLAILISCLGLFGLAAYTAERRTKEIGIRKVLGASAGSIATLLSRDFLKLVLISCLLAFPIAWWAMSHWLQSYAYRINLEWWVFAGAGILAVLIALSTVSLQAVRAAMMNPVKSLRME